MARGAERDLPVDKERILVTFKCVGQSRAADLDIAFGRSGGSAGARRRLQLEIREGRATLRGWARDAARGERPGEQAVGEGDRRSLVALLETAARGPTVHHGCAAKGQWHASMTWRCSTGGDPTHGFLNLVGDACNGAARGDGESASGAEAVSQLASAALEHLGAR